MAMSYRLVRDDDEIDDVLGACVEAEADGTSWPGMSYEQGVQAAIRWMTDESANHPIEE